LSTDFTLITDSLADGPHTITLAATDKVGNVSTSSFDVAVDRQGQIYHARTYDGDPSSGGTAIDEQWGRLGTKQGRTVDPEHIKTRATISCPPPNTNIACDEVRVLSQNSSARPGASESYEVHTGSSTTDPSLDPGSDLVDTPDTRPAPAATGPIADAAAPWQYLPPAHGATYARYDTTGTDPDSGLPRTEQLWLDAQTQMPIKQSVQIGSTTGTEYWTYDVGRLADSEVPADLFSVGAATNTGLTVNVQRTGDSSIGQVADTETSSSFTAYYLGPLYTSLLGTSHCLSSADIIRVNDTTPAGITTEDPTLEVNAAPPGAAQTSVDAAYMRVSDPTACHSGSGAAPDPDLQVISYASSTTTAARWLDAYRTPATAIQADPTDDDFSRAGVVPVTNGTTATLAYVLPADTTAETALLQVAGTTIIIQGNFTKQDLPDIVLRLVPR
jgi:hypothetical protein